MKNKKKTNVLGIVAVCVFIGLIFVPALGKFFAYSFRNFENNDFYIFESIEECEKIETLNFTEQKITKYENPEKDKKLKSLQYEAFYGAKYESKEVDFEIFAYEFATEEDAESYYKNATGKDPTSKSSFSSSWGVSNAYFEVIYYNKVYRVETATNYLYETKVALGTIFSIQV